MELTATKQMLLDRVEKDRDVLVSYLQGFLRTKSPNPPGDTRESAKYISDYLDENGIEYHVVGPDSEKPNIVSSFDSQIPGKRLVLNGHIDVFPVGDGEGWSQDPWGGELVDGKVYGRGACDMKAGTTASIYTYKVLHELKEQLKGSVTLTAVSDEETGGRLGAGWLIENVPETLGDCCLNGEPSSPFTFRFGEKGILWLKITVQSPGGHGAYPHLSVNPIKVASKLITELETLTQIPVPYPENLRKAIDEGREAAEKALGVGGADVMKQVSVNIGSIEGGVKVNVIPRECSFEVDLRIPPGLSKDDVLPRVEEIVSKYEGASFEVTRYDGPLWSPPDSDMASIIRGNSKMLGIDPVPIVSLGGSDLKFWRSKSIPSYYYGPMNNGMGTVDEFVEVDAFIHVVKVHLLSAYEYLMR